MSCFSWHFQSIIGPIHQLNQQQLYNQNIGNGDKILVYPLFYSKFLYMDVDTVSCIQGLYNFTFPQCLKHSPSAHVLTYFARSYFIQPLHRLLYITHTLNLYTTFLVVKKAERCEQLIVYVFRCNKTHESN